MVAESDRVCIGHHPEIPRQRILSGDVRNTLANLPSGGFAVIHCDLGDWDPAYGAELVGSIKQEFSRLLVQGGVLVSGTPVFTDDLVSLEDPCCFPQRYFFYEKKTALATLDKGIKTP
jgi:hypothetical protein